MNTTTARRLVTSFNTPSTILRRSLLADAILTSIAGIVLVLAARPLGVFLNLEPAMLEIAGLIFFPVGAFAGWLGTRPRVHRSLVIVVIVLNALWAVDSVLLLLTRWVETTPMGEFFVIGQAVIVAIIAELELIGLRRSTLVESYARH
jgi:hypothetical protein